VDDPTISYDRSGNRIGFSPYDWEDTYTVNDLNQYTFRDTSGLEAPRPSPTLRGRPTPHPRPTPTRQQAATYDYTGNIVTDFDSSTYRYDAQNRLLQATKDYKWFHKCRKVISKQARWKKA